MTGVGWGESDNWGDQPVPPVECEEDRAKAFEMLFVFATLAKRYQVPGVVPEELRRALLKLALRDIGQLAQRILDYDDSHEGGLT